jgi:endo-1,4-beta-xylanase
MGSRTSAIASSIILLSLFCATHSAAQDLPLRESAAERDFLIGAAVAMSPFRNEPVYQQTLAREFNIIVAENAFKWDSMHPARNTFNFTDTDALVDFAESHGMKIRGHTLVWHNQIPDWLRNGGFSRDEVTSILRDHILTFVGRYRGRVWAWDVVNEAIDDSTSALRTSSFWYQTLGPDYINLAFQFAHEADPNAILYYNDYSIEGLNAKSDAVFNLVRDLKNAGVPIDGVGWQMHQLNGFRIQPANQTNARRLADLGLQISITEMDVRINLPTTPDKLEQQALAYQDTIDFCLSEPNCKALVTWGFTDKYSWIPGVFSGWGDALPLDASYQFKPAYYSLREVLERGLDFTPRLTGVSRDGKKLLVAGEKFEQGAQLFVNGEKQKKVSNDSDNPSTLLVARKSGKTVKSGDVIQVKNPDGRASNELIYP